jgi:AcrR family transcriptional regulator
MRNLEKDAKEMAARREAILREGFRLFSEESIESVKMTDVAKAAGIGIATLYRYYSTKPELVLAINVDQWKKFTDTLEPPLDTTDKTAAQCFSYYLDHFIQLFREFKPLLRFNQNFNSYVIHEKLGERQMEPYIKLIEMIQARCGIIYEKARTDGTVKMDMPEDKMFSYTIHVMMAVIVRYAQGLVYNAKTEETMLEELELLKTALLNQFVA